MFDNIIADASERMMLAAHRGVCGGNIPCNTMGAFKAALDLGADIIELDVALSMDKKLFVFHPGMEYPHLRTRKIVRAIMSSAVNRLNYVNSDRVKTEYGVETLDEVLDFLKGKCYINVDKFWTAIPEITACIRYHGMEKQVIVKTPAEERYFDMLEQYAPELPFMPMVHNKDDVTPQLLKRKMNYIGVEALFQSDDDPIVQDAYISSMHEKGLLVWGNAIVYNYKAVIAADHTDDTAILGDKKTGWLWYANKHFDIVQTDWLAMIKQYYQENNVLK